LKLLAN